nr:hypothetical protein CFP56_60728 [Quercus suber]
MFDDTQLRRHERRTPRRLGRGHVGLLLEHLADAKVHDLQDVLVGDETVVRLDVAMDDALGVQVFDPEDHVAEPAAACFLRVWIRTFVQADLHDHALLAHLQHNVQRILVRIVEDFDQGYQVVMIKFLHDGDLFLDQVERIVILAVLQSVGGRLAVQRRVEADGSEMSRSSARSGFTEQIRLRALAETRFGELLDSLSPQRKNPLVSAVALGVSLCSYPSPGAWWWWWSHIFSPELIQGQMHGAETASSDLLLDDVLVDAMDGTAVILAAAIVRACVEGFPDRFRFRGDASVVSDRALIGRR